MQNHGKKIYLKKELNRQVVQQRKAQEHGIKKTIKLSKQSAEGFNQRLYQRHSFFNSTEMPMESAMASVPFATQTMPFHPYRTKASGTIKITKTTGFIFFLLILQSVKCQVVSRQDEEILGQSGTLISADVHGLTTEDYLILHDLVNAEVMHESDLMPVATAKPVPQPEAGETMPLNAVDIMKFLQENVNNNDLAAVRKLLQNPRIDWNFINEPNLHRYPLHDAIRNNNIAMVKALSDNIFFLNMIDINGDTPLTLAMELNNNEICAFLIKRGAKLNEYDTDYLIYLRNTKHYSAAAIRKLMITPLVRAINDDNNELVERIVEKHPNLDEYFIRYGTQSSSKNPVLRIVEKKYLEKKLAFDYAPSLEVATLPIPESLIDELVYDFTNNKIDRKVRKFFLGLKKYFYSSDRKAQLFAARMTIYFYIEYNSISQASAKMQAWATVAADRGSISAYTYLGYQLRQLAENNKDDSLNAKAIECLKKAADHGDYYANFALGYMYSDKNLGNREHDRQGLHYFEQANQLVRNVPICIHYMGVLYNQLKQTEKDILYSNFIQEIGIKNTDFDNALTNAVFHFVITHFDSQSIALQKILGLDAEKLAELSPDWLGYLRSWFRSVAENMFPSVPANVRQKSAKIVRTIGW